MRVCVLADLPVRSVARVRQNWSVSRNQNSRHKQFQKQIFRNCFKSFRRNNYLLTKLEHRICRETTVRDHFFHSAIPVFQPCACLFCAHLHSFLVRSWMRIKKFTCDGLIQVITITYVFAHTCSSAWQSFCVNILNTMQSQKQKKIAGAVWISQVFHE